MKKRLASVGASLFSSISILLYPYAGFSPSKIILLSTDASLSSSKMVLA